MKKYLILFLAIFALFFSSCSKDDSESSNYVGTWALVEEYDGDLTVPYYYKLESGGTFSAYEYYGSMAIYKDGVIYSEKQATRSMAIKVVFKGNKMYTNDDIYLATIDKIDDETIRISDTSFSTEKGIYKRVKGFSTYSIY